MINIDFILCGILISLQLINVVESFILPPKWNGRSLSQASSSVDRKIRIQLQLSLTKRDEYDVILIGSGIGGMSCAAILASQGVKVGVFESHYELGGVAHEFYCGTDGKIIPSDIYYNKYNNTKESAQVFKFEAGPSLYSGLSSDKSPNPLKHVFQIIGEEPEWITYNMWKAFLPEAPEGFDSSIGAVEFEKILLKYGGESAVSEWQILAKNLRPLTKGVMSFPSMAMRPDINAVRSLLFRYPLAVLDLLRQGQYLVRPFSKYYDELQIKNKFLKNYLNLLCFLLQGLPAEGTLSAVMAYMIEDFFRPNAVMDFPVGGSSGIISALERGILKNDGIINRRSHVDEILVDDGKVSGIRLRNGTIYKANTVVSNCDLKATFDLVRPGKVKAFDEEREQSLSGTPLCRSFVHLHLGIDATNLPDNMPPQWTVCNTWDESIDSPGNVIVVSMPSLLDPSLAPPGHHVIHAYTAGNEPYEIWEKFKDSRQSPEYKAFKEERAACLWNAVEKQIPDARSRARVQFVGSPLTHERFNRRFRGNYGPAIAAGQGSFPGQATPIKGLYRCGDSTNPGIGVPAVASSGAIAAAAILPINKHLNALDLIRL